MNINSESDDKSIFNTSPVVGWLGYGGLLPFVALSAAVWFDENHRNLWHNALINYGAMILSFVGALHWGLAMSQMELTSHQRNRSFVWSIVPALVAWVALMLLPNYAIGLLVAGFWLHFLQDRRLVQITNLPRWYLPLRLRLTMVASASLLLTYFS